MQDIIVMVIVLVLCERTQDLRELIQQVVLIHSSLLPDGQHPTQLFLTAVLAISGQMRQNRHVNYKQLNEIQLTLRLDNTDYISTCLSPH